MMLDGEMGFRLTGKYAHYLANGHFSGATASRFPEVFNYGSLIATVAWPSSEAFQIITEIDNGIVDFQRTLVIRVPRRRMLVHAREHGDRHQLKRRPGDARPDDAPP